MIYHHGERRVRRVLRLFQSLLRFSGAFAFSLCSAVDFKDIYSNLTKKFDNAIGIGIDKRIAEIKQELGSWFISDYPKLYQGS